LNVQNVPVAVQSDLDVLLDKMSGLDLLIIDSFQALTVRKHMTSRKKEHHCIAKICERAKQTKCTVIVLCHLTKQGTYKGSTTLLHAADALININIHEEVPTLRVFSWGKNRFGPADKNIEIELTKNGYRWSSGKYKAKPAKDVVEEEQKLIKEGADIILDLVGL
jgi:predicted ATP-dependent serine protease